MDAVLAGTEVGGATKKLGVGSFSAPIRNDPYKVSNAITMELNNMAGQLFELSNSLNKLMM